MTCHRLCQWRVYARPGRFFSGFAGPRGRAALGYTPAALAPEILIVGDRSQRGSLIPRVQDLGYTVTPVRERELGGRVASAPAATAVLICLGETDASTLVDAARSGRDDVPLILVGTLGGELRDLADVLELGADHFLAAPVTDEELARVLADVVGPGAPNRGEGDDDAPEAVRPLTGRSSRDPVLGQLHRTLEILAARLKSHESGEGEPDDLDALGLDALPDVDPAMPDGEDLVSLSKPGATLVLHLAAAQIDNIVPQLLEGGYCPETPCAVVAFVSWPTQQVITCTLAELAERTKAAGITKTAVILVGEALGAQGFADSYLYSSSRRRGTRH